MVTKRAHDGRERQHQVTCRLRRLLGRKRARPADLEAARRRGGERRYGEAELQPRPLQDRGGGDEPRRVDGSMRRRRRPSPTVAPPWRSSPRPRQPGPRDRRRPSPPRTPETATSRRASGSRASAPSRWRRANSRNVWPPNARPAPAMRRRRRLSGRRRPPRLRSPRRRGRSRSPPACTRASPCRGSRPSARPACQLSERSRPPSAATSAPAAQAAATPVASSGRPGRPPLREPPLRRRVRPNRLGPALPCEAPSRAARRSALARRPSAHGAAASHRPTTAPGQTRTYEPGRDRRDERPSTTTYRPDRPASGVAFNQRVARPDAGAARGRARRRPRRRRRRARASAAPRRDRALFGSARRRPPRDGARPAGAAPRRRPAGRGRGPAGTPEIQRAARQAPRPGSLNLDRRPDFDEEEAARKGKVGGGKAVSRTKGEPKRREGRLTIQAVAGDDEGAVERMRSLASVRRAREREREKRKGGAQDVARTAPRGGHSGRHHRPGAGRPDGRARAWRSSSSWPARA